MSGFRLHNFFVGGRLFLGALRPEEMSPAAERAFLLVRPVQRCRTCGMKYMVVRWMWWRLAGCCQRRCMRDGVLYLSQRTLAALAGE